MIIIDGTKSTQDISKFANLEEALAAVMQEDAMQDRVVTDILVNNEAFSEIYPHQAEDMSCDEITSLEVRSVPSNQMAVEISAEMEKVARMMGSGAKNVARLFRDASDTDALELFQDLLDVTRDFMNTSMTLRSQYIGGANPAFDALAEKFSDLLSEMSDVMENEDWILLSDLLEYEFQPICDEWKEMSEKIHKSMLAAYAQ